MTDPPVTEESRLFNVSMRTWSAVFVIVAGTSTICYLSIMDKDPNWVMVLLSSALSFLFGKAAGKVEGKAGNL